MQDFQSITGQITSGRIFTGWDNRRLRSYPSATISTSPPLKCPRCDSQNTKFCYYNNYNLSQPRHFCKSCRRYWTKGGVLRNVPVGGGCRKPKRSSNSKSRSTGNGSSRNPNPNSGGFREAEIGANFAHGSRGMEGFDFDGVPGSHEMVADRGESGGVGWPAAAVAVDSGIYEIAGDNDPAAYWSQSQWVDGDHSFYIPSL